MENQIGLVINIFQKKVRQVLEQHESKMLEFSLLGELSL